MTEFDITCIEHQKVAENIEAVSIDAVIKTHMERYGCDSTWLHVMQALWTEEMELEYLAGDMHGEI